MEEREFTVGEQMLKNEKHNTCPVCEKKFKMGEKIMLCPIQKAKSGFINAIALPIHTDCYMVDKD